MRVVLDTNVLISAPISKGKPHELLKSPTHPHPRYNWVRTDRSSPPTLIEARATGGSDLFTLLLASRVGSIRRRLAFSPSLRDSRYQSVEPRVETHDS